MLLLLLLLFFPTCASSSGSQPECRSVVQRRVVEVEVSVNKILSAMTFFPFRESAKEKRTRPTPFQPFFRIRVPYPLLSWINTCSRNWAGLSSSSLSVLVPLLLRFQNHCLRVLISQKKGQINAVLCLAAATYADNNEEDGCQFPKREFNCSPSVVVQK